MYTPPGRARAAPPRRPPGGSPRRRPPCLAGREPPAAAASARRARQLLDQALDPLRVRLRVDPVDRRHPLALEQLRDLFVGEDHQPLDQAVGLGLRDAAGADHVALRVEAELGLGGLDVEAGRAAVSRPAPRPRRGRRQAARRRPRARSPDRRRRVELVVVETGVGADPAAVEARRAGLPAGPSSISAVTASRSTPGARLQASSLSARGSIGSTVPGT